MSCCACCHAGMGTTPKDGWGPVPHKEPEGWQGSLGTASRAQLTGCCLAARSKRVAEMLPHRLPPENSPWAVSRKLLERPQA